MKYDFAPSWCLGGEDQLLMASESERRQSLPPRGSGCRRRVPPPRGRQLPLALMGRGQQGPWGILATVAWPGGR